MFTRSVASVALASLALQANAVSKKQWSKRADHLYLPKETSDYKTAYAPSNVTVRYKNPGICETTPGVDSYSGYVDLTPDVSVSLMEFLVLSLTLPRFMSSTGSLNRVTSQSLTPLRFGSMAVLDQTV